MATVLPWGETITVLMDLGFPVNPFTLDSATIGILDTNALDGSIIGDDVAPYTQEVSIVRGRQDQLSQVSAGLATVTLLNNDRRFDPINEDSPYWDPTLNQTGVTPRRKVTIKLGSETVFVGRIDDIDLSYSTGKSSDISTVTITASDAFSLISSAFTTESRVPTEQLSGARLSYLLALDEVSYTDTTDIDTGTALLGNYTIDANTNVLTYAQQIADSERGFFFVARDGTLTFTDRISAAFAASAGSFSDDQGTNIKYQDLSIVYGEEFLFNKITVTRNSGTPQIGNDTTSQDEYGISTLSLDNMLLASDSAAQNLANDLVALYGEPKFRFENMKLMVSSFGSGDRTTCNQLDIGDTITVERNYQTGTPSSFVKYQTVNRLNRVITPNSHHLEIGMSDAYVLFAFTLDDAVYGILDSDNALT